MSAGRAIFSASDKRGYLELAEALAGFGWELLGTSGSVRILREHGIEATSAEEFTGAPEVFGGRVKTLHPKVFGGLLYRRGLPEDEDDAERHGIPPIDMVVCNFYRFADTVRDGGHTLAAAQQHIDVGGPAMIRAAAKNFDSVLPLVDPDDYPEVMAALAAGGGDPTAVGGELRRRLAAKAFETCAAYDAEIAAYLASDRAPLGKQRRPDNLRSTI
jgi:phosphoribosylaminoimidazolecarboxamide formyltransferase/IMP cyclohydrolase